MTISNALYWLKEIALDTLIKSSLSSRLVLIFLFGAGLSFIQAPYNFWFLIFPCFGFFYFLYAQAQTKRQVFLYGFVFAFGYFTLSLYWIGNALLVEGNNYRWVWPLAVVALPALLSLFTALYLTIAHIVFSKNTWNGFLGTCALLGISEWVRGHAFTGFPWNLYGYSWIDVLPIAQSVSLIGPYGLTLFTIIWGASIGFSLSEASCKNKKIILTLSIFSFIGFYVLGDQRLSNSSEDVHDNISIHIVQPNINQADKWKADELVLNFEKHLQLSILEKNNKKNIIIWPETSLAPSFINNATVNQRIYSIIGVNDVLLAGGLNISRQLDSAAPEYNNALMLWSPKERAKQLYTKSHLVPFGEYIPFQKYIPIPTITSFSGFKKGMGAETIQIDDLPSFSPLICYEIIFPHEVLNKKNDRPDYILTITNDGWYGDSAGPYQHFSQARFRAIEQGLPVVRAANTGISGIIDPYGHVTRKTKLLESSSITSPLPRGLKKATGYSAYQDLLFFIIFALFFGIGFRTRRQQP
jgi:apolipoprotein N-acyltransferase